MRSIVRIKFGSHLYGTDTSESDTDYKAVHIPDARDILLQRVQDEISVGGRTKREGERNTPTDTDDKSYALHKYLRLLAEGQTVALDMLFAPLDWVEEHGVLTEQWVRVVEVRNLLLTKRSAAFVGYCRQQANKYGIKGSRVAAAKAASEFFSAYMQDGNGMERLYNVVFPQSMFNEHTKIVEQDRYVLPLSDGSMPKETFFECCNRKVSFGNTVKAAAEIYTRVYQEYGDRARRAQSNDGVDWKALSHAVRVGQEAVELLTTGRITFPLPQAEYVRAIKLGQLSYNEVATVIEKLLEDVERASVTSSLPEEADRTVVDGLILDMYGKAVNEELDL